MATTISSITRQGAFEPFGLQVARNQIQGHTDLIVFGYNPDLDDTEESIWPNGGTIPHPTTASVLKISSTSASDTSAGTGARTIFISGVNGNFEIVSETVILNGLTEVNTVNLFLYVNELYVATVGSGGANAGNINAGTGTVTSGVPAVLYDMIYVGFNQRTTAHYCVPAGYTGYLIKGVITAGQASGSTAVTSFLKQHGTDNILRVGAVSAINNGSVNYDFDPPYVIPAKNCVGASAIGSANNNIVSSFFNIILIKEGP